MTTTEYSFGLDKYDYRISQTLDSGDDLISIEFDSNSDTRLLEVANGIDNANFKVFLEGMQRTAKYFTVSSTPDGRPVILIELLPAKRNELNKYITNKY